MENEFCMSRDLLEELLNFIESETNPHIVRQEEDGTVELDDEGLYMEDLYARVRDEVGHFWL